MDEICPMCNKNEKEVYQLDFEGCYECWMDQTMPVASTWSLFLIMIGLTNLKTRTLMGHDRSW